MSCWGRRKRRLWKSWRRGCEGCSVVAHLDSVQKDDYQARPTNLTLSFSSGKAQTARVDVYILHLYKAIDAKCCVAATVLRYPSRADICLKVLVDNSFYPKLKGKHRNVGPAASSQCLCHKTLQAYLHVSYDQFARKEAREQTTE
jgi:hypothetical protein